MKYLLIISAKLFGHKPFKNPIVDIITLYVVEAYISKFSYIQFP